MIADQVQIEAQIAELRDDFDRLDHSGRDTSEITEQIQALQSKLTEA